MDTQKLSNDLKVSLIPYDSIQFEIICNNLFLNNIKPQIPFNDFVQILIKESGFTINYKIIEETIYMFSIDWQIPLVLPTDIIEQSYITKYFNNLIMSSNYEIIMYGGSKIYDSIRDNFEFDDVIKHYQMCVNKNNNEYPISFYQSFEGTTINVYHYHNTWHFSTKRVYNMFDSKFGSTKTYGQMFREAINMELDEFEKKLHPELTYQFILIHPENTHITKILKPGLILMCIRYQNNINIPVDPQLYNHILSENIIPPIQQNNNIQELLNNNYSQGVIIMYGNYIFRVYNNIYKKEYINNPKFNTLQEKLIYDYQHDKLINHKLYTIAAINYVAIVLYKTLMHFTQFTKNSEGLKFIKCCQEDYYLLNNNNAVIRNINKLQYLPYYTKIATIDFVQVKKHIKYHCTPQDIYAMYLSFKKNTLLLEKIGYIAHSKNIIENVNKFETIS